MPVINTLSGRSTFSYRGNVLDGVVLEMSSEYKVSKEIFNTIINVFANASVPLGASMTDPISGGLGDWVANNSPIMNPTRLTHRHASFVAAILVHEKYASHTLNGNRIILTFPAVQ